MSSTLLGPFRTSTIVSRKMMAPSTPTATASARSLLVDVHTHVYTPRLVSLMRERSLPPKIVRIPIFPSNTSTSNSQTSADHWSGSQFSSTLSPTHYEDRLLLLPSEPSKGRPIGPEYWSRREKLKFMDLHEIDVSIVSTANPWLDFLKYHDGNGKDQSNDGDVVKAAREVNEDLERFCSSELEGEELEINSHSESQSSESNPNPNSNFSNPFTPLTNHRLYAFGLLPLVPGIPVPELIKAINQISESPHLKGYILGTKGLGKGLDDPDLEEVWKETERKGLVVFLHPHYGFGSSTNTPTGIYGPLQNGHVLPLSLGFPLETTISSTRLLLSGIYDRYPNLKLLLAHSGGALPLLSGRIQSCLEHEGDREVRERLNDDFRWYFGKMFFDAVAYGREELEFAAKIVGRSGRFGRSDGNLHDTLPGIDNIMFGTDNPFFPSPLPSKQKWKSVTNNLEAINSIENWSQEDREKVKGKNAIKIFGLEV